MEHFLKNIRFVLKSFLTRKTRSLLTVLGIVIGVSGVIVIISLGAGAQALVLGQITKLGTNLVAVLPGKSNETGPPAAVFGIQIKTLSLVDLEAIKDKNRVPHVVAVAPFVRSNITIVAGREFIDTSFTATEGSYPRVQNIKMDRGVFFSDEEGRVGSNVIVLGYDVAEKLFPDGEELGKIVKLKSIGETQINIPFRVIGVQEKLGNVAFQNQDYQVLMNLIIQVKSLLLH